MNGVSRKVNIRVDNGAKSGTVIQSTSILSPITNTGMSLGGITRVATFGAGGKKNGAMMEESKLQNVLGTMTALMAKIIKRNPVVLAQSIGKRPRKEVRDAW